MSYVLFCVVCLYDTDLRSAPLEPPKTRVCTTHFFARVLDFFCEQVVCVCCYEIIVGAA